MGGCTLTYQPLSGLWTGSLNYAYGGGCAGLCVAATIPVSITLFDCDIQIGWHVISSGPANGCPAPTGNAVFFDQSGSQGATLLSQTVNCSPFSIVQSWSGVTTPGCQALWGLGAFTESVS